MKSKIIGSVFLLFLVWQSARAGSVGRLFIVGTDINPQGHVARIETSKEVAPQIAAILDQALMNWSFVPTLKNGIPVPVHTYVTARVDATPKSNGRYTISVTYVGTGPEWNKPKWKLSTPMACGNCNAIVVATVNVDSSGRPSVTSIRGVVENNPQLHKVEKLIEQDVTKWIEQSSFVTEKVNGESEAFQISIPTIFHPTMPDEEFNGYRLVYRCTNENNHTSVDPLIQQCSPYSKMDRLFLEANGYDAGETAPRPPVEPSVVRPKSVAVVMMEL